MAAGDDDFWHSQVKEPALLYVTSLKPRSEITDDGHHTAGLALSSLGSAGEQAKRDGKRKQPRHKNRAANMKEITDRKIASAVAAATANMRADPAPKQKKCKLVW